MENPLNPINEKLTALNAELQELLAANPDIKTKETILLIHQLQSNFTKRVPPPKVKTLDMGPKADFEELKELLESKHWPLAVPPSMLCNSMSEDDKVERAEGIIELMIEKRLKDLTFLDFGCGEGHVTMKAKDSLPRKAVGYDIKQQGTLTWEEDATCSLTTDFEKVKKAGPYDVILLYDVLDHLNGDVAEVMKQIRQVCTDKTTLYLRCHPWCSRHGGHHYQQINKAFVHLVFEEHELAEMGYTLEIPNKKVIHPLGTYKAAFTYAEFKVLHEDVSRSPVENFFFHNKATKERIRSNWSESKDGTAREWPKFQMEQSFIDYVLTIT